jgi:crossover junction endodeoxyribonuclease RuvC
VDVFRTAKEADSAARVGGMAVLLAEVIDAYKPDMIALERVFAQHNVRTVMGTAQISGVVLALAHERKIPVSLRTPSEVKAAVTGHGRANKQQVGFMVQKILGLSEVPQPADAADALALAITEAWRGVSPSGPESTGLTPAQQAWRDAEAKSRRPRLNT